MILSEFVEYFENGLQIPRLNTLASSPETMSYLQNDSERIYYGNASNEVKRVAFMVQPHQDICIQAVNDGYDTLFSHHRWRPKNALSPLLGDLDNRLKMLGIGMLSYHLYWDIAREGIAESIMTHVFDLPSHETLDLTYREFRIPHLARWTKTSLSFEKLRTILEMHYIRTERYLGHLDWTFDRLVVIPGGGLENSILESLDSRMTYDGAEKIVIISSGSGQDTGENYLDFFHRHEKNYSILDANHYDLEAIGVAQWAQKLGRELAGVACDMFYADDYINYSI
jgi:putative NIF3 family GTP cyclohydrolase 1 type 2